MEHPLDTQVEPVVEMPHNFETVEQSIGHAILAGTMTIEQGLECLTAYESVFNK